LNHKKGGIKIIKKNFKKIFFYGTLFVFIIATIVPSITGNIDNNEKYIKESKANIILNDDYINSYWKFDECSGNTVGDSSSPHYDGTLYGATWVSTSSGCALLFDGVDDYVNFSDYAAELFFNKTDDFIISFYFKSTGTGHIYSATAPWGFNPDFQIQLVSNGTLLFKLIGSSHLGITLYSNGVYNDGEWHYVEYYHNGITSTPTVTLYVDNVTDSSMTSYYYNIENDEYTKATMGVSVHSFTDYFDGYIDEFKIIKYERGNKQDPPIISGPTGGNPEMEYDYTFSLNDPEGDDVEFLIDWSDGTEEDWRGPYESGQEITVSHKWNEEGQYNITAKTRDIWHDSMWSSPYLVTIGNNSPPEAPYIDGPRKGAVGVQYGFIFQTTDPDGDRVIYEVNWGDGKSDEAGPISSGEEVILNHAWDTPSIYTIKARARDEIYGTYSEWSELDIEIPRVKVFNLNLVGLLSKLFPSLGNIIKSLNFVNIY